MPVTAAIMVPHPPLIIPEVGGGNERIIQKTTDAYKKAAEFAAKTKPETLVIISPHQIMYSDYFHISGGAGDSGDFGKFLAPQVRIDVDYDTALVSGIENAAAERGINAGTYGARGGGLDHGTMVPLYFVNKYMKAYKIIRVGLSGMPLPEHYRLGMCIRDAAESLGRKVAIIASGDLSHRLKDTGPYGFAPEGPLYDEMIMDVMGGANFGRLFDFQEDFCQKAAECGHRAFTIMAGCLDGTAIKPHMLSHEGQTGVGYGICIYECGARAGGRNFLDIYMESRRAAIAKKRERGEPYVSLARETIEAYAKSQRAPQVPKGLPEEMYKKRAGVFVSIKKDGQLRGCIGTIMPCRDNVAQEIVSNAISASSRDPRFPPVREDELDFLDISVDVLGIPERITSPESLDVKRFGVIVTNGARRGLLLPNLDGIDTVKEQIAIARKKAGIAADEPVTLERFEVVRHTED